MIFAISYIIIGQNRFLFEEECWIINNLMYEVPVRDSILLNGIVFSRYKNGQIKSEISFENGKRNGLDKFYYPNGQIKFETNFVNEKRHGKHFRWFKDGRLMYETNFLNGSGVDKIYYQDGHLRVEEYYKNGDFIGDNRYQNWVEVCKSKGLLYLDNLDTITCKDSILINGIVYSYHRSNHRSILVTEFNCKEGKKHGLYRSWHINGLLMAEGNYKDGKEDGLHQGWYENGQLEIEANYINGIYEGKFKRWFEDGKVMYETDFINGNGIDKEYYKNGQIKTEINYKNGNPNGIKRWHGNGTKINSWEW